MKKITRILLFSSVALYLTTLWNHGLTMPGNPLLFIETVALIGIATYLIVPLSKAVLFPIQILSFGLLSIAVYMGIFYLSGKVFDLPTIKSWIFPGGSFLGITVGKVTLSYLGNLAAVSCSVSGIITILEKMT